MMEITQKPRSFILLHPDQTWSSMSIILNLVLVPPDESGVLYLQDTLQARQQEDQWSLANTTNNPHTLPPI